MSRTSLRETLLATTQHNALKLNVGFLLNKHTGYSREIAVSESRTDVAAHLAIDELHGQLRLTRTPPGIYVAGSLITEHATECSRCLKNVSFEASIKLSELYGFPPSDEAEFSISEDGELDLAPLVRELIVLEQPSRILCQPDCVGLCPTCGADHNVESCLCEEDNLDPRLSVLQSLLDKT